MSDKKSETKKRGSRVLRFAESGALLVGASGSAACDDELTGVNEPPEELHINEPDPGLEPTMNEPAPPPDMVNEPAPSPEIAPAEEEGASEGD